MPSPKPRRARSPRPNRPRLGRKGDRDQIVRRYRHLHYRRRHFGVGASILAGGIGAARVVVGPTTSPAPGDQARGAAIARTQFATRGARPAGRTARVGRGPIDSAGASLLDAASRRVGIKPGGGAAPWTKSLPAQRASAA